MTHRQRIELKGAVRSHFLWLARTGMLTVIKRKNIAFKENIMGWHGFNVEVNEPNGTSNLIINAHRHI